DTTCWPAWRDGSVQLAPPRHISELSGTDPRGDPSPSYDDLTLYYVVSGAHPDLYYATPATPEGLWAPRGPITELDTTSSESKLTVTGDGLLGVFSSDRGPAGMSDLWVTTRGAPGDLWGAPSEMATAAIETPLDDFDSHITPDGLDLYF